MAYYKVIQDVEAEDKILGPLSLKQLIFAIVTFAIGFIAFRVSLAVGNVFVIIPFLPFAGVFAMLAFPFGKDQPTEVWLAALIRFYTKPRKRIWDQSDIKHLVNITVPPKQDKQYTDGLNQDQVRSRLQALASTLDSRGWAVKNVSVNDYVNYGYGSDRSDRLIDPSTLPQAVSNFDVKPSDDIFDVDSNPTAHHFDELAKKSNIDYITNVLEKTKETASHPQSASGQQAKPDFWFMHQNPNPTDQNVMFGENLVRPGEQTAPETFLEKQTDDISQEEKEVIERAKKAHQQKSVANPHHKVILTPKQIAELEKQKAEEAKKKATQPRPPQQERKTTLTKADKIELVEAASDMKISTVKSLADHKTSAKSQPDEVIINLR